jgi:hypothetical protein
MTDHIKEVSGLSRSMQDYRQFQRLYVQDAAWAQVSSLDLDGTSAYLAL